MIMKYILHIIHTHVQSMSTFTFSESFYELLVMDKLWYDYVICMSTLYTCTVYDYTVAWSLTSCAWLKLLFISTVHYSSACVLNFTFVCMHEQ